MMTALQILILLIGATVPIYSYFGMYEHTDNLFSLPSGCFARFAYIIFCLLGGLVVCLGLLKLIEVTNLFFFGLCYLSLAVLGEPVLHSKNRK